jgi:hypothetical protein
MQKMTRFEDSHCCCCFNIVIVFTLLLLLFLLGITIHGTASHYFRVVSNAT